MAAPKGSVHNPKGRPAGKPNKATVEFRQAVTNLLNYAAPEMIGWLQQVAETSPDKALDHVSKLAEYANPKLARQELVGADGKDLIPKLEGDALDAAIASRLESLKAK
jgi:hypothetical protein